MFAQADQIYMKVIYIKITLFIWRYCSIARSAPNGAAPPTVSIQLGMFKKTLGEV